MFKFIVLCSALSVVTFAQPITEVKDAGNQLATDAINLNPGNAPSITVGQSTGVTTQFGTQAANAVNNLGAQAANAVNSLGAQAIGTATQIGNKVQQQYELQKATLGQIIDRLGDAAKLTIIEERESIAKALQSIGTATGNTFKAGIDTLGSGFDMILIVPKFAVNALGLTKPTVAPIADTTQ